MAGNSVIKIGKRAWLTRRIADVVFVEIRAPSNPWAS